MKIKVKETFNQKFSEPRTQQSNRVQELRLAKDETYNVYIMPEIVSISEEEGIEIDYPFKFINTHYVKDFTKNIMGENLFRINCKGKEDGCPICTFAYSGGLKKDIFKIAAPTKFALCYVVHNRIVKMFWIPDYFPHFLYTKIHNKIGSYMKANDVSLVEALQHRIKIFTNAEGLFDCEIEEQIMPMDSEGAKKIFSYINKNSIDSYVEQFVETNFETLDKIACAIKDFASKEVDYKKEVKFEKKENDYEPDGSITDEEYKELVGETSTAEKPVGDALVDNAVADFERQLEGL